MRLCLKKNCRSRVQIENFVRIFPIHIRLLARLARILTVAVARFSTSVLNQSMLILLTCTIASNARHLRSLRTKLDTVRFGK